MFHRDSRKQKKEKIHCSKICRNTILPLRALVMTVDRDALNEYTRDEIHPHVYVLCLFA